MFPLPASSTGTQHNQDTLKLFDPATRRLLFLGYTGVRFGE